jgi:glycosyltransferase involved in cell wall biosynthesis
MNEKKIMLVIPSLRGGGAEKAASLLLEEFLKAGVARIVLILFDSGPLSVPASERLQIRYLNVKTEGSLIYIVLKFFRVIRGLTAILKEERPCSVLSFMDYSNVAIIISSLMSGRRNRIVLSVHTLLSAQMRIHAANYRVRLIGILVRLFYRRADSIVAVSEAVKADLTENFNIDSQNVLVINNPAVPEEIEKLSSESVAEIVFHEGVPVVLFVGRLSRVKGVDSLLKAFSRVAGQREARLVVLGEGDEKAGLRRLSSDLGLDSKVHFLGYKENPYKYMKNATLFVLPSLYEGFGIVLVEAMACGIPVVATKSYKGIEDIVADEKSGLLVPVGDENALASAIIRLLDDSGLRALLAEEGKKRAIEFSADKIAEKYMAVLGC